VEIKKLIEYGKIGEPVIARTYRANPMPKSEFYAQEELSGGVIIDLGLHDIDFLAWALGPVETVFAQGGNFSGRGGETLIDYAQIHFNFKSGAIAHLEVNWALPDSYPFSTAVEIVGTAGMVAVDNSQARSSMEVTVPGQSPSFSSCREFNGYYLEQDAFLQAVQNGAPSPVPPGEAMYAMILATAAKESIKRGRPVTPEEVEALSLSSQPGGV
jgi:predicted dehydrogenase